MVMPPSIAVARHCALPSGLGIFIWLEQLLITNQSYSVQCWTAFISGRLGSVSCKGLVHAVACKVLRGREKKKLKGTTTKQSQAICSVHIKIYLRLEIIHTINLEHVWSIYVTLDEALR